MSKTDQSDVDPKKIYDKVVRHVELNTGGYKAPLTRRAPLVGSVCRGEYHPSKVTSALSRAQANGDIFVWSDDEGRKFLGVDDVDHLREAIAKHVEMRDSPNTDLIGIANQRIAFLEGRDDGT